MQQLSSGGILHQMVLPLIPLTYFSSILSAVATSPISLSTVTMCLHEAPGVFCSHKSTTSVLRRSISVGTSCSIWCNWEGWSPNIIPSWYHLETPLSSEERFFTFRVPENWALKVIWNLASGKNRLSVHRRQYLDLPHQRPYRELYKRGRIWIGNAGTIRISPRIVVYPWNTRSLWNTKWNVEWKGTKRNSSSKFKVLISWTHTSLQPTSVRMTGSQYCSKHRHRTEETCTDHTFDCSPWVDYCSSWTAPAHSVQLVCRRVLFFPRQLPQNVERNCLW